MRHRCQDAACPHCPGAGSCRHPVNSTGVRLALQPPHLAPEGHPPPHPRPWGVSWQCPPLRPPRARGSGPEEPKQLPMSQVGSMESSPEGTPPQHFQRELTQTKAMGFPRRQIAVQRRKRLRPAQLSLELEAPRSPAQPSPAQPGSSTGSSSSSCHKRR